MLKVSKAWIRAAEQRHPGFTDTLDYYEALALPLCPLCGSTATATAITGVIGRTMELAAATTKIRLVPNGPHTAFYCETCGKFFDAATTTAGSYIAPGQ
jgi:pyruvate/2-oxoacid:ferredoxin oxidoreductase beta subunit